MVKRRKALGRGLEALLGKKSKKYNSNIFKEINIDKIKRNNNQPRSNFNEKQLNELAKSISTHGIIQPITVRKIDENTYQLISGERRFRASKISKLKSIPAFIKNAKDNEMLEMALIENIQRENLNSLEIAISYKKLIDELKINQENLAKRVGKDRSTINNYLRLLKLPPTIQKGIIKNKIQMGHARSLITIETSEMQLDVYKKLYNPSLWLVYFLHPINLFILVYFFLRFSTEFPKKRIKIKGFRGSDPRNLLRLGLAIIFHHLKSNFDRFQSKK